MPMMLMQAPYWPYDIIGNAEPPHFVIYRALSPTYKGPHYVPPQNFIWEAHCSPSDCTWIVPGTGQ